MVVLANEDLCKHTTVKIGGRVNHFYIPDNEDELVDLVCSLGNAKKYVISGGSNLLINDRRTFENVISLQNVDNRIIDLGQGKYYVGASVRIQKFIRAAQQDEYGGLEFLFSVPGMVGGLVAMNAGRGKVWNQNISNCILNVRVLKDEKIMEWTKEECGFDYRKSRFLTEDTIVLGATLQLNKDNKQHIEELIAERMNAVENAQDRGLPNFGSVFCESNTKIMSILRRLAIGRKSGIHFSRLTPNWMVNGGKGTFQEAICLINIVKVLHKLFHKEYKVEVQIWN